MHPLTTTTRVRFTPDYYRGQEGAPVYLLAPLTLADRTRLDADVLRAGAIRVTTDDVREACRQAATDLLDPPETAAVHEALGRLEELEAARLEHQEQVRDAELRQVDPPVWTEPDDAVAVATLLDEFDRVALRNHRRYAHAKADAKYYLDTFVHMVVRYVVRGIEGGSVPYEARGEVLTEACLERIPLTDRIALAAEAMRLVRLGRDDTGN